MEQKLIPSPYVVARSAPPEMRGTLETKVTFELVCKTIFAWLTGMTLVHKNILITPKK